MRITAAGTYSLDNIAGAPRFALAITDRTGTDDASGAGAGDWNSATAKLQYLTEEGDMVDHPDGSFTANVSKRVDAVGSQYQLVVTGTPDITVDARPVG